MNRRLDGLCTWSGHFGKERNLCSLPGIKLQTIQSIGKIIISQKNSSDKFNRHVWLHSTQIEVHKAGKKYTSIWANNNELSITVVTLTSVNSFWGNRGLSPNKKIHELQQKQWNIVHKNTLCMVHPTSLAPPDVQGNLIMQPGIYVHVSLPFRVTVTPTKSQTGIPVMEHHSLHIDCSEEALLNLTTHMSQIHWSSVSVPALTTESSQIWLAQPFIDLYRRGCWCTELELPLNADMQTINIEHLEHFLHRMPLECLYADPLTYSICNIFFIGCHYQK